MFCLKNRALYGKSKKKDKMTFFDLFYFVKIIFG